MICQKIWRRWLADMHDGHEVRVLFGFEHTRFRFGSGSVTAKVRFGSVLFAFLHWSSSSVRFGSFKNEGSSSLRSVLVRFYSHLYRIAQFSIIYRTTLTDSGLQVSLMYCRWELHSWNNIDSVRPTSVTECHLVVEMNEMKVQWFKVHSKTD